MLRSPARGFDTRKFTKALRRGSEILPAPALRKEIMEGHFLLSLGVGIFIGGAAGYLGSLMLSKRMALVAGPLGHLTLPGIALALIYGFDVSLGAFPFVIFGIVLIWLFEMRKKLPMEVLKAVA